MAVTHIRLEADVAKMVGKVAKRNSRTAPREVNHVLREYYTTPWHTVTAIGPDEPMPPPRTVLDAVTRPKTFGELAKCITHEKNRQRMRG